MNLTYDVLNNFVLFSFKEIVKPVSPSELFPSLPIVQVCLVTFHLCIIIPSYVFYLGVFVYVILCIMC